MEQRKQCRVEWDHDGDTGAFPWNDIANLESVEALKDVMNKEYGDGTHYVVTRDAQEPGKRREVQHRELSIMDGFAPPQVGPDWAPVQHGDNFSYIGDLQAREKRRASADMHVRRVNVVVWMIGAAMVVLVALCLAWIA